MAPKAELRSRLLAKRNALSQEMVDRASACICKTLIEHPALQVAKTIALYLALPGEIDLTGVIDVWLADKKTLFSPAYHDPTKRYILAPLTHPLSRKKGRHGVFEPVFSEGALFSEHLSEVDCVLVPGVGFDRRGHRLGFGKGYYDQLLADYNGPTIGIAYDWQVVEPPISNDDWDRPMTEIITDMGSFSVSRLPKQ